MNWYYYLQLAKRRASQNFWMELIIAITAPGSAVAGLAFWETDLGKSAWVGLALTASLAALVKPLLKLDKKSKELGTLATNYHYLEYDLGVIAEDAKAANAYDKSHEERYGKARERGRELIEEQHGAIDDALRKACFEKVKIELPADSAFVPGG